MRSATPFCGLTNKRGGPKPPRNSELYEMLHGDFPHWAKLHDSLDDVRVTAHNFKEGCEKGWWW